MALQWPSGSLPVPLESASFISDLVTTNPIATDPISQADDHLRLLKSALKTTFPNVDGAVTGTPAQLNQAAAANAAAGILEVAANGPTGGQIVLDGVAGAGDVVLVNTATSGQGGSLAINLNSADNTTSTNVLSIDSSGNMALAGFITAAIVKQAGFALLPAGCIVKWSGSVGTVPSGWHLCDGTAGTIDLRDKFVVGAGGSFAPAQTGGAASVTTATATAGAHAHGGVTVAAGGHTPAGVTDTQGAHAHTGATAGHSLSVAELAPHNHTVTAGFSTGGAQAFSVGVASITGPLGTDSTGSGAAHSHGITTDGAHSHNLAMNAVPDHAHAINSDGTHAHSVTVATLPPFYAIAFIQKL
jgi:hypothetical protein